MKGKIEIKVTDKDGNLKKEVQCNNMVLPTYKHRVNAFLPWLPYLPKNNIGLPVRYGDENYLGITIHQDLFDVVQGSEEYVDLQYKIPYLIGGVGGSPSSVYADRVEQSSEEVDTSVNHYVKSTWLWTSPHDFTIKSLSLKNNNFVLSGLDSYYGGIRFGDYLFTESSDGAGDNTLVKLSDTKPSLNAFCNVINESSYIQLTGTLFPLYYNYVLRAENNEYAYSSNYTDLYVYSHNDLRYISEDVSSVDHHWTRHIALASLPTMSSENIQGNFWVCTVPCEGNDYLVYTSDDYGLKIFKIDRSGSNDTLVYSNDHDFIAGWSGVIGNLIHINNGSSVEELVIKENNGDFDSVSYRIGDFYAGGASSEFLHAPYIYRNSVNTSVARDDAYCSKAVAGTYRYEDNVDSYMINVYDNTKFLNQTYKNLDPQDFVQVQTGDRVLVTYTVSLEGDAQ